MSCVEFRHSTALCQVESQPAFQLQVFPARQSGFPSVRAVRPLKTGVEGAARRLTPLVSCRGLFKTWRGSKDYVTWITDFEIMLKKVKSAWMDLLPTVDIMDQQFTSIAQQEPEFLQAATPQAQHDVLEHLYGRFTARRTREHMRLFPIGDNLLAQLFLVQADLSENQRERLISSMTLTGTRIDTYQYEAVKAQVFELFCTTRTGLADPRLRTSVHGQHRGFRNSRNTGGRSFAILDSGDYDGQFGYWVQDEDTFEEGFIAEDDEEEVFWQVDDNEAFVARRFKRRPQLRRAGKGRRKGKGRKRGRFRSNRKGSAHTAEGDDYNSSFYGKGKGKGKSKWKGGKEEADFAKGKGKGKNKGRVRENPLQKAVSPLKQKARPRSQNKLQQQPPLPQRTGVGTPKRTGRRGKKVHTLQRTIKTKARESPREAKTRKSYVYKEEAQMDQCTQKQTRNKKFQNT